MFYCRRKEIITFLSYPFAVKSNQPASGSEMMKPHFYHETFQPKYYLNNNPKQFQFFSLSKVYVLVVGIGDRWGENSRSYHF